MASSAGPKSKRAYAESGVCDVRHAESELGFVAAKSLAERIEQTLRDYRADGWL
jgi:nucleoside-diphosphate-sugar epimerase